MKILVALVLLAATAAAAEPPPPVGADGATAPRWATGTPPVLHWTEGGAARSARLEQGAWAPAKGHPPPRAAPPDDRHVTVGARSVRARARDGALTLRFDRNTPRIVAGRVLGLRDLRLQRDAAIVTWLAEDQDEVAVRTGRFGPEGERGGTRQLITVPKRAEVAVASDDEALWVAWSQAAGPLGVLRVPLMTIGTPRADNPATDLGAPVPALTATGFDGRTRTLSDLKGPLLVNLWASWCPPCMRELPGLVTLHGAWAPQGVTFVGVALDRDLADAEAAVERHAVPYLNLHDPEATALARFATGELPATFVYDRQGKLLFFRADEVRPNDPALLAALAKAVAP